MALYTTLFERELASAAFRAAAEEILLLPGTRRDLRLGSTRINGSTQRKRLLHAFLLRYVPLDGLADRVWQREHFARTHPYSAIRRDSPKLVFDGRDRNSGTEGKGDKPPDRLGIRRRCATRLPECTEHLKGAATLILVDRDIKIAER